MKLKAMVPMTFFIPETWGCIVRKTYIKSICYRGICKVTKEKRNREGMWKLGNWEM
jgi:hypothetical protein